MMRVNNQEIRVLAQQYRAAMNKAKGAGAFAFDEKFCEFPDECCGDTCNLLAVYLMNYGIQTLWISNDGELGSHAWLVVMDDDISEPSGRPDYPDSIKRVLEGYGAANFEQQEAFYREEDLENGTIVDITADQFDKRYNPVYVDKMDSFHRQFEFRQAYDYIPLPNLKDRLKKLYQIVDAYLD